MIRLALRTFFIDCRWPFFLAVTAITCFGVSQIIDLVIYLRVLTESQRDLIRPYGYLPIPLAMLAGMIFLLTIQACLQSPRSTK